MSDVSPPVIDRTPRNRWLGWIAYAAVPVVLVLDDPLRLLRGGTATGLAVVMTLLVTGLGVLAYAVLARPLLRATPGLIEVRNELRRWSVPASQVTDLRLGRFSGEVHLADAVIPAHGYDVVSRDRANGVAAKDTTLVDMLALAQSREDVGDQVVRSWPRPAWWQWIYIVVVAGYLLTGLIRAA